MNYIIDFNHIDFVRFEVHSIKTKHLLDDCVSAQEKFLLLYL